MQRRKFIVKSLASASVISLVSVAAASLKPGKKPIVTKAGEDRFNEPIKFRGISPNLVKVSAKDTDGQMAIFEYEGFAKMGPELHIHLKQDEFFYVLEGEYLFQVAEERHILKAGDTIFLPRNIPHTWLQLTDKGKLSYLVQPAGKMEEFFKKMNSFTTLPTPEEIANVHLDHDIKVVGPPLTM